MQDTYFLFDAGLDMGNWAKQFYSALNDLSIDIRDIQYCFVSHNHLDHIGMLKRLKRKNPNINIIMNEVTHELMHWETDKANLKEMQRVVIQISEEMISYGLSKEEGKRLITYFLQWPQMKKYIRPDIIVQDDQVLNIEGQELKIIWTPGHSLGHTCLFQIRTKILYAGDHILSRITPHIGVFIMNPKVQEMYPRYNFRNILKLYLNSLERIEKLNPKVIFPAHQEIITNPQKRIIEIKEHHENRLEEISSLIKNNPMLPLKIAQKHFGKLDEINMFLALSEVLSHLYYLEEQGNVKRILKNSRVYFEH